MTEATTLTRADLGSVYAAGHVSCAPHELTVGSILEGSAVKTLAVVSEDAKGLTGEMDHYMVLSAKTFTAKTGFLTKGNFLKVTVIDEDADIYTLTLTKRAAATVRVNRSLKIFNQ